MTTINNYTLVGLAGSVATGAMSSSLATITATNGTVTCTAVSNSGGTVSASDPFNVTRSVTSGASGNRSNTNSGTYAVSADRTPALTDSDGNVYTGALADDGNALVLASVTATETPSILAGIRQ